MRAAIPGGPCRAPGRLPLWTRAAPAACRDPRRRSWTRRPGGPCGRACEELPAAWARRRSCQPSRRAIHPAAILDTSPTAPAPGGDPRRPAAELPRQPAPRPCCPCPRPRSAPRRAAPLDARPRATPRAITRALRAPGCNPYGVAFTAQRATPARYASAHPCAPASRAARPRAPPRPCARVALRARPPARVRARPLPRVGTARVIFFSRGRCDPAISLVFLFFLLISFTRDVMCEALARVRARIIRNNKKRQSGFDPFPPFLKMKSFDLVFSFLAPREYATKHTAYKDVFRFGFEMIRPAR